MSDDNEIRDVIPDALDIHLITNEISTDTTKIDTNMDENDLMLPSSIIPNQIEQNNVTNENMMDDMNNNLIEEKEVDSNMIMDDNLLINQANNTDDNVIYQEDKELKEDNEMKDEEEDLIDFDESQFTTLFWERSLKEVQMTKAEIEEEEKEKDHVEYIKRVNIEDAVSIIKVYLKYKYE